MNDYPTKPMDYTDALTTNIERFKAQFPALEWDDHIGRLHKQGDVVAYIEVTEDDTDVLARVTVGNWPETGHWTSQTLRFGPNDIEDAPEKITRQIDEQIEREQQKIDVMEHIGGTHVTDQRTT